MNFKKEKEDISKRKECMHRLKECGLCHLGKKKKIKKEENG